jgi:hypothetical protein
MIALYIFITCLLVSCSVVNESLKSSRIFDINKDKAAADTLIFNEESEFAVNYPAEEQKDGMTTTPYFKVYAKTDGSKLVIKGTGEEDALVRIVDRDEIYVTKVDKGVFEIQIPITKDRIKLDVTAKLNGKKRSGTVTVTNK